MAVKCGVFKTTYKDDEAIWQTKVSKFWLALLLIGLLVLPVSVSGLPLSALRRQQRASSPSSPRSG